MSLKTINKNDFPLIFTDLDGTLLDHEDYSWNAAEPLIEELAQKNIPVIANTSKTRAEWLELAKGLNNPHPFIVENGAAIFIPKKYFPHPEQIYKTVRTFKRCAMVETADYLIVELSLPRIKWRQLIQHLQKDFDGCFASFSQLGPKEISDLTDLSLEEATLANRREYSEPLHWQGTPEQLEGFVQAAEATDNKVLIGGRFVHLTREGVDKGNALNILSTIYEQQFGLPCIKIALGDSQNDLAQIQAADIGIWIKTNYSDSQKQKTEANSNHIMFSEFSGPEGWMDGLTKLNITTAQSVLSSSQN